ncbi:MAG: hypothetical protein M1816_005937 [Peltula sp. TS41687]|nr:MAG: hypothetical protein M1816_005937 [Peltula sp. TS41687]
MVLNSPAPYARSTLDNSPLAANGSDYPCKQRDGVYDLEGASNFIALGSTQLLAFTGSAVHGGESCQFSITYDMNPTKDSVFKVIHSIIGGCPARGVKRNLLSDPNGKNTSRFNFKIPDHLSTGEATLAWTWFNKLGVRHMFMNCAPATITRSDGSFRQHANDGPENDLNKLPDMFTATTLDSKDLKFPNPGSSVETNALNAVLPECETRTDLGRVLSSSTADGKLVGTDYSDTPKDCVDTV